MGDNKLVIILVALLAIVFLALIRAKRKQRESRKKYNKLKQSVDEATEYKHETSKRRYVSRTMKAQILERDNRTCQICGISKAYLDSFAEGLGDYLLFEIDHITPVASGGSGSDADNLQVLCWRCNRKKGKDKTNEEVAENIDYGIKYLKGR